MINFMSIKKTESFQQYNNKPMKMINSDTLSIEESKNAPPLVDLSVKRAMAPSTPSKIPVVNTKIEKNNKFLKIPNEIKLRIAKKSIIKVAILGVTPILLNPNAIALTNGRKIRRTRNFEGMRIPKVFVKYLFIYHIRVFDFNIIFYLLTHF